MKLAIGGLFCVAVAAVTLNLTPSHPISQQVGKRLLNARDRFEESQQAAGRLHIVGEWLETQRRGGDGKEFWVEPNRAPCLFAVRSWERVDRNGVTTFNYRIDSSNKTGQQITKTWEVRVSDNKPYRIEKLRDLSD